MKRAAVATATLKRIVGRLMCRAGRHRWSPWLPNRSGVGHSRHCRGCGMTDAIPVRIEPDDGLTDAEFWAEVERQSMAEITRRAGDA